MFGWLGEKAFNSRVMMCIKEVKWDIEARGKEQRAEIFLTAQDFFFGVIAKRIDYVTCIENIDSFRRSDIKSFYVAIEDIRNEGERISSRMRNRFKSSEAPGIAEMAEWETKRLKRGVELWMVTLGIALKPDLRQDIAGIWRDILDSQHLLIKSRTSSGVADIAAIEELGWFMPKPVAHLLETDGSH